MASKGPTSANGDKGQQIASDLGRLFQRRIEMTKWEAFTGLTPPERAEYDQIEARIDGLFRELAKLGSTQPR